MIEERTPDGTGWAMFSDDRVHRYRLARALTLGAVGSLGRDFNLAWPSRSLVRVVFVMLNPSTANAFKPDRTVSRCVAFAQRWGADVLEIVNLFAFVSPYPKDLKTARNMGDDETNDAAILAACNGAARVIAGWGTSCWWGRDRYVRAMLVGAGIRLEHLGLSSGAPKHPLARGKHFIPYDREPEPWAS